ncbi:MAG: ATP-binding protein, partial [bacterium]
RTAAAAERSIRMQRVTAALAIALTAPEVAEIAIAEGVPAFGAADGVVYFRSADGESLTLAAHTGLPEETLDDYATLPMDAPLPLPDAVRNRKEILLESREQALERYPHLRHANARAVSDAWIALPLVSRDTVLAGMVIGFKEPRRFTDEDRVFGETLARLCAQALERARLYEEAQQATRTAEAANAAKSQFLATMSHELRTPLNAFGGYLELILMELRGPITQEQRVDLERMQRSNRHLSKLIEDLLNFAKIEVGHVTFNVTDVDVQDLVVDLSEMMRPQCQAKQISVSVPISGQVIARADAERLRQVLMNLLGNAVKFTPAGGHVSMWCEQSGAETRINVRDTGPGIPANQLDEIFAPFVQVGRRLNAPGEGVGLGLAISRELALGMGGVLSVRSALGEGSTFTLTLATGGNDG